MNSATYNLFIIIIIKSYRASRRISSQYSLLVTENISQITIDQYDTMQPRRSRGTSRDLVLIFPTWSCMSGHKLLQSHLLRNFHYLIGISLVLMWLLSRYYLVAVCPVSCCWLKFQSILNPCNPLQQTRAPSNGVHCEITAVVHFTEIICCNTEITNVLIVFENRIVSSQYRQKQAVIPFLKET